MNIFSSEYEDFAGLNVQHENDVALDFHQYFQNSNNNLPIKQKREGMSQSAYFKYDLINLPEVEETEESEVPKEIQKQILLQKFEENFVKSINSKMETSLTKIDEFIESSKRNGNQMNQQLNTKIA